MRITKFIKEDAFAAYLLAKIKEYVRSYKYFTSKEAKRRHGNAQEAAHESYIAYMYARKYFRKYAELCMCRERLKGEHHHE